MKALIRRLLARLGFELRHRTPDPVLKSLDHARDQLRLHPGQPPLWAYTLSQLTLTSHLRDLLVLKQPDLVVDVGANRGQFALLIRQLGYSGPIVSLEPQPALALALHALAETTDPLWTILSGAAGEADGELVLNRFSDDTFSSFHTPTPAAQARFGTLLTLVDSQRVTVRPLDAWLAETSHRSAERIFLKTDTQGHDLAVLAGASLTLARSSIVLAEGSLVPLYDTVATPDALATLLAARGFRPAGQFAIAHDDRDLAAIELDCLFTRAPAECDRTPSPKVTPR